MSDVSAVPELDPLRKVRRGVPDNGLNRVVAAPRYRGVGSGCRTAMSSADRRFTILRVAKIKTMGNLMGSCKHTFRERETHNADPDRLGDNEVLIGPDTAQGVADAWAERAPEKIRKNAVHALEYLVTASPAAMHAMGRQDQDAYFDAALDWLAQRHGAENILSAVVHRDETTPHLFAMVIPLDDRDHLNARMFTGGKVALSEMQTSFTDAVGDFGLDRGIHRSGARHTTIQEYYARANSVPEASVSLPERERGGLLGRGKESDEAYAQRLSQAAKDEIGHVRAWYEERLAEANAGMTAQERIAAQAERREQDARRELATGQEVSLALSAWRNVETMEEGKDRDALMREFFDQWEKTASLVDKSDPIANAVEQALEDEGFETKALLQRREAEAREAHRETGRPDRDLDDDSGWGL